MAHHTSDWPLTAPFSNEDGHVKKLGDYLKDSTAIERAAALENQLKTELGPTRDFPSGRLVPHDEGGLMFGLTVFKGRVIFDFGKPIRSIGFTREGALELAELIKARAEQIPAILIEKD